MLKLSSKTSPFPYAAVCFASYIPGTTEIVYDEDTKTAQLDLGGSTITDEAKMVQAIANAANEVPIASDSSAKIASFFALASTLQSSTAVPDILAGLDQLDDHLAWRTFLVGHTITSADWIVWGTLRASSRLLGLVRSSGHLHLQRWFSYFESLPSTQEAFSALAAAKASKARNTKAAAGFQIGLKNATMGQVVTRFPPEPSGYLHIGHAKAAMLNQYFAKMYQGKLIIRFDDTNPSKERTEFEDTILEDLHLLDIKGDKVTHSSDYFDELYNYAIEMIKHGKAYTDDTPQTEMKQQRWEGLPSAHREDSIDDNLAHFDLMKSGSEEGQKWCLRAKISVDNPNKALRDPVIYRVNTQPHHRTGDKWKIYPTYDFACPIVDSIEGVTHALRTNEYRDRHPQYDWMIQALGVRPVNMWDFSRLNFIYTLLSKRKLHWFVDNNLVRGWDDPRFPTVRGIRRRGMTVEALAKFMLSQGPSQAVVSLEWDSIWASNKKIIDPVAPRHWAIVEEDMVPVTIIGGPDEPEVKVLPKHKKNEAVGTKKTVYSSKILLEQEDAKSFDDGEEVTLMDWGNAILKSRTKDASGKVTSMEMQLHLAGDFKLTKKKITWLAPCPPAPEDQKLVPVTLLDHDYLITKKKLEEDEHPVDFLSPMTEFREYALADANVTDLKKGDIMQFERKGYFIYDGEGQDGRMEFVQIPDGRAASLASKAGDGVEAKVDEAVRIAREKFGKASGTGPSQAESAAEKTKASDMYSVKSVYGEEGEIAASAEDASGMYKMKNVYA